MGSFHSLPFQAVVGKRAIERSRPSSTRFISFVDLIAEREVITLASKDLSLSSEKNFCAAFTDVILAAES
jgi:hypothetical protein